MKKPSFIILPLLVVLITSSACQALAGPTAQATPTTGQPTQPPTTAATDTAVPQASSTPEPTQTPAPQTGSVSGRLGYPSEMIPALHLVAFLFGTDTYYSMDTPYNQAAYQLDGLPAGKYHMVAYTQGSESFPAGISGGYTQAVPCGMTEACTDHSLVDVTVQPGQVTQNVDLVEWFVPLPPIPQPGQPVQGAITGRLSYPSEFIPPQRVVAFKLDDGQVFSVDTQKNQSTYTLFAPAGNYHVVAYVLSDTGTPGLLPAGYSQMVPCGLSVDCTDHSLIEVTVVQGSVTAGVDPGDYYAPEGTFPAAP